MNHPLILVPAYGRKYKDAIEATEDYFAGKDFKIQGGGPYCSCRDFPGQKVTIAWNYQTDYIEVKTPEYDN